MTIFLSNLILTISDRQMTIISLLFGIIGTVVGIAGYRSTIIEKKRESITWDDMVNASNYICKEIRCKYQPDVIYILNIKSGIRLQFMKDYFKEYIPAIVRQAVSKKDYPTNPISKIKGIDTYIYFSTSK